MREDSRSTEDPLRPEIVTGRLTPERVLALGPIVAELAAPGELDELFRKLADHARGVVDYDGFGILLLDDLGQQLRYRFARGFPPGVVENCAFDLQHGAIGLAVQSGMPQRIDDYELDDVLCGPQGTRSELVVPLTVKGRPIGAIDVRSRHAGAFDAEIEQWLGFLAPPLANSIENARLYGDLREQAGTLSLLHELSHELTSILDTERLLHAVASAVKRLIDYQVFHVMVWSEQSRLLEHTFSLRYDQRMVYKGGFPLGHGITGSAAALRRPIRVPNVDVDPRFVDCGHEIPVRSEIVVPLLLEGRLLGVLDLESTRYNAFTERHEQMLGTLAPSIANALENARLVEQLRAEESRLESELETARRIQLGLLPSVGDLPGLDTAFAYRPARELGGDFYDRCRTATSGPRSRSATSRARGPRPRCTAPRRSVSCAAGRCSIRGSRPRCCAS